MSYFTTSPQISLQLSMETVIESTKSKNKQLRAKPDSPFAPPGRTRTNLRVGRSLRRAPPFKDGRREAFSTSFFVVEPFFSSSASFRDLNLELPRLVNLLVVVSVLSVADSVSVVSGGAVAFVRRRKLRFAACGKKTVSRIIFYFILLVTLLLLQCLFFELNGMLFITRWNNLVRIYMLC